MQSGLTQPAKIPELSSSDSLRISPPERLDSVAWQQYLAGDRLESLKTYHTITALYPGFQNGFLGKSKLLLDLGRYSEALATSDSALLLGENAESYYIQARINEAIGESERASWAYSKAIQSDSSLHSAIFDYTSMLLRLGNMEEAILVINEAVRNHPGNTPLILLHSNVFAAAGRYQNSINDMTLLIGREPSNSLYSLRRGRFRYQAGEYDLALEDLQRGIGDHPAEAWYYIGATRMEIAQKDSSRSAFEKAITYAASDSPDSVYIRKANEKLFALNRESDPPFIRLQVPSLSENEFLSLPSSTDTLHLRISVIDRSRLKSIEINGQRPYFNPNRRSADLSVFTSVAGRDSLRIGAIDEYDNQSFLQIPIVRKDSVTYF